MKLTNKLFGAVAVTLILNSTSYAACPKDDDGSVKYEKIPLVVKDKAGDVSGFPVFYWDEDLADWSDVNNSSGYVYDQNAALDIKSLSLCLDDGERNTGLGLFMRISMAGFPGAYKDLSNNKLFLTGTGPLSFDAVNPQGFSGSMVFKIADASKLSQGTPVYFMVASFNRVEGEYSIGSEDSEVAPGIFWLMKSKTTVHSKEEFDATAFSPDTTEFVADLDEEGGKEPAGIEPGEEGEEGGEEGEEGPGGDDQFNTEVPAYIQVEARVEALTTHAGIGKNSNVLVSVAMTTERPAGSEISSLSGLISDSSPSAKGKLSKLTIKKSKAKK